MVVLPALVAIVSGWALAGTAQAAGTNMTFSLTEPSIVANGTSQVTGTATVRDATDAVVPGDTVTFSAALADLVTLSPTTPCTTGSQGTSAAAGSSGGFDLPGAPDSASVSLAMPIVVATGNAASYTASVSSHPGPVVPSGAVQFLDNRQLIASCLAQPIVNGKATCTVAYGSAGNHTITARYLCDSNFTAAASSPATISVITAAQAILGKVTAMTGCSFYYTPRYTRIIVLSVRNVSTEGTVTVTCKGGGCPHGKGDHEGSTPQALRGQTQERMRDRRRRSRPQVQEPAPVRRHSDHHDRGPPALGG
jgi:hypothetical protein